MTCLVGNIALRRPTRQESTRHGGHASRGVDGHAGSCSHSYSHYRPWWRVDLQHQRYVYKVTITNTNGGSWTQLRNFEVRVGAIDSADGANILYVSILWTHQAFKFHTPPRLIMMRAVNRTFRRSGNQWRDEELLSGGKGGVTREIY